MYDTCAVGAAAKDQSLKGSNARFYCSRWLLCPWPVGFNEQQVVGDDFALKTLINTFYALGDDLKQNESGIALSK